MSLAKAKVAKNRVQARVKHCLLFFAAVNFEIEFLFDEATECALSDTYRHL